MSWVHWRRPDFRVFIMIFLQMASNGNGDNKNNQLSNELKDTMQKWRPFGRSVPAPRNVMLADPELANPIPNRPEAMQSGWVPNPERDGIELGSSPQVDCCLRRQLNRNESVINLLCGHLTHEGCVNDLLHAYSLEGCRICCDRSTNQQRIGKLVNLYFLVHLIQFSDKNILIYL